MPLEGETRRPRGSSLGFLGMFGLGEGIYPALTGILSQLRLKDAGFPAFGGKPHPKPQPSLMLHAGMNVNSPFVRIDTERCDRRYSGSV